MHMERPSSGHRYELDRLVIEGQIIYGRTDDTITTHSVKGNGVCIELAGHIHMQLLLKETYE